VLAGREREALLWVADQLSSELGYTADEDVPGTHSPLDEEEEGMMGILNSEDELLVATLRHRLAVVAAAVGARGSDGASSRAVGAALDGAELVMRGELLRGNGARLPALMPSFVFLVTLPLVDRDRALELSQRTARLVEGALGGERDGV
jgi:hypothetical protein